MPQNSKTTGKKAASNASKTLRSKDTGAKSKKAAGSALSQTKTPKKKTGAKAASAASKTLKDGRTSKSSKSAAGSTLAQTPSRSGRSMKERRIVQSAKKAGTISRAKSKSAVTETTNSRSKKN